MGHQSIASPSYLEDLLVPKVSGTYVSPSRCSWTEDLQVRIKCREAILPIQLKAKRSRCVQGRTQCTNIYRTHLLQDAYEYIAYRLVMKTLERYKRVDKIKPQGPKHSVRTYFKTLTNS